jgi:hypothetical protein
VFAQHDDRHLEVLGEAECLNLLGSVTIGRVAFTEGALPAIQPVSFRLDGGDILIPSRFGSKVAAASRGAVLAFEVDDVQLATRTGWNVTVVGLSRLISDPADVRDLDRVAAPHWLHAEDRCYISIAAQIVRGQRVSPREPVGEVGYTAIGGAASDGADVPA